jgi:hypothetical protein
MNYCVFTRFFYEDTYLDYFIQHYINLGFNKIIILKPDNIIYNLPYEYLNIVEIHYVENLGDNLLSDYQHLINSNNDWVLSVDSDELLILNNTYKNIDDFVKEKLINDKLINAFYFRWGMIEKVDIENNNNFTYILQNYKIFKNSHIKTMFKLKDLIGIYQFQSHVVNLKNLHIYFENNIYNRNFGQLTITENSYKEHILIHLHTRSINNLIVKSFNTVFDGKQINNKNNFIEIINNFDLNSTENILQLFINNIGAKAQLPYTHNKEEELILCNYDISKYNYDIVDSIKDKNEIINFLNKNKIEENNYFYFVNLLSFQIINDKTFIKSI